MNNTVSVVARIIVQDQHLETVTKALRQAVAATRLEDGCELYDLFQSQEKTNELVIIERWRDEDALAVHVTERAFIALSEVLEGKAALHVDKLNALPV